MIGTKHTHPEHKIELTIVAIEKHFCIDYYKCEDKDKNPYFFPVESFLNTVSQSNK